MAEQVYKLVFLIECVPEALTNLEAKIREVLAKELSGLSLKVEPDGGSAVRVLIEGEQKWVDSAHGKLLAELCPHYESVWLIDDLGETLRVDAFRILARIEPRLRTFINEAMTKALGFGWWEKLADEGMKARVATVESKNRDFEGQHHPTEFTEFEHLVKIVTGELSHWRADQTLTAGDLAQLFLEHSDFESTKIELAKRMKPESLWDTVFAKLFADQEAWLAAKKDLTNVIIPIRHKVSHHRFIRLFELRQLEEAVTRVLTVLDEPTRKLKPDERRQLREQAESLIDRARNAAESAEVMQNLAGTATYLTGMQEIMSKFAAPSPYLKGIEEMGKSIARPSAYLKEMQEMINNFTAPSAYLKAVDEMGKSIVGSAAHIKRMQEMINKLPTPSPYLKAIQEFDNLHTSPFAKGFPTADRESPNAGGEQPDAPRHEGDEPDGPQSQSSEPPPPPT